MRKKIFFVLALCFAALLSACSHSQENQSTEDTDETSMSASEQTSEISETTEDGEDTEVTEQQDNQAEDSSQTGVSPVVYMTTDISSEGLMAVYAALEASPSGNVAVKISTGENGSNYLRTDLLGDLVQSLDATIVECNTAYGGNRASTAMHYQLAEDHGYTAMPVFLMSVR